MTSRHQNYITHVSIHGLVQNDLDVLSLPVQKLEALDASQVLSTSPVSAYSSPFFHRPNRDSHHTPQFMHLAHSSERIRIGPDFSLFGMGVQDGGGLLEEMYQYPGDAGRAKVDSPSYRYDLVTGNDSCQWNSIRIIVRLTWRDSVDPDTILTEFTRQVSGHLKDRRLRGVVRDPGVSIITSEGLEGKVQLGKDGLTLG